MFDGSFPASFEVEKKSTGLDIRIWREMSEVELRGLEGETMAPRESSER